MILVKKTKNNNYVYYTYYIENEYSLYKLLYLTCENEVTKTREYGGLIINYGTRYILRERYVQEIKRKACYYVID